MIDHGRYMERCIELALLGMGSVSPNPMVGAVVVYENRIIGEGYHMKFGESHAEVNAIKSVLETLPERALRSATLYVSLEPCAHLGKTPPCVDLIISKNIPRVVIGCRDLFAYVNGMGIQKLKDAGIDVIEGILEDECKALNKRFTTRVAKQRPYIILKWAQTRDGFFAPTGDTQKWITSSFAKQLVHRWRSEEDSILVGKNTARNDNPQLNVREWYGKDPIRIVIDRNLELTAELNILDHSQRTIIFNAIKTEIVGNIKYLELEDFDNLLPQLICYQLYLMDIQSIIIEGGARTLNLFLSANLWDEARVFSGPDAWGQGILSPTIESAPVQTMEVGPDILNVWRNDLA